MHNTWTHVLLMTLAMTVGLACGVGCSSAQRQESEPAIAHDDGVPSDGVFLHVSRGTDNPHAVLMALKMANIMADDHDVLVYFDLKGVEVVLRDAPDLKKAPFESSHQALKMLMLKGVGLYACPGCLQAAGKTADDLIPYVQVANKDAFFDFTDGRILTLDY